MEESKPWRVVGIGCPTLIVCLFAVGLVLMVRSQTSLNRPTPVTIKVDVPESVGLGEPFVVKVTVINLAAEEDKPTILNSIDFSQSYLDGFEVKEVMPAVVDETAVPFVDFYSYRLDLPVSELGTAVSQFTLQAVQPGHYSGDIDVCINSARLCQRFAIQTTVMD